MVHLIARSTCGGRRLKSSDGDLTVLVGQGLDPCLEKLHDSSRKLSRGSGEARGLWKWLAAVAGARVAWAGGAELAGAKDRSGQRGYARSEVWRVRGWSLRARASTTEGWL
jgi:hypothetical protein